jgi:predicted amidophosphoribosyltransferase
MRAITLADVERLRELAPKRRRFAEHAVVSENTDHTCTASLKFSSIARLFERETGISTRDGPYGPYCRITDKGAIKQALKWQEERAQYVFLRDNLGCSVALDFNLAQAGLYTGLGQAEHDAKASQDKNALRALCSACLPAIERLLPYRQADAICAVPPSPDKDWDLPTELVRRIAGKCGKADISPNVKFAKKKESVKELSLADKWKALLAADLQVSRRAVAGKSIILLDDKYQSGTTAQFVAAKMFESGAQEVYGHFCVKTWRDTDNQ